MSTAILTTADTTTDLRAIYEDAILNSPRSLQTTLGPSELGTGCNRCLIHMLAGHQQVEHVAPWLPTIGTAVHAWCEEVLLRHMTTTGDDRWRPECRVMVGHHQDAEVWGTCDVYDAHNGVVVDLKVVGKTTLDKVRRNGPSTTYQHQIQLYGKGWEDAGHHVTTVALYLLPRNAVSLQHAQVWQVPYDRSIAVAALVRADQLAGWITAFGVDTVLEGAGPHTGDEFSCSRFGDGPSKPDHQLDRLIA